MKNGSDDAEIVIFEKFSKFFWSYWRNEPLQTRLEMLKFRRNSWEKSLKKWENKSNMEI